MINFIKMTLQRRSPHNNDATSKIFLANATAVARALHELRANSWSQRSYFLAFIRHNKFVSLFLYLMCITDACILNVEWQQSILMEAINMISAYS